jgi:hypothetical protein
MSGPQWLSMMQTEASAAREESAVERAMARLGLTVREARDDEIRIQRRDGNWHVDWRSGHGWVDGWAKDDDEWPMAICNQWNWPVVVAVDFQDGAYVFFFRGRFVVARLRAGEQSLAEALPEVSELVEGLPQFEDRVHEADLDVLLDTLPDSDGKAEAVAARDAQRLLAQRDARHAALRERFAGVDVTFTEMPDDLVSFDDVAAWDAEIAIMVSTGGDSEPSLIATRDADDLVRLLHWHRLRASYVGPVALSLHLHVLLVRGRWVLADCAGLVVPAHLEEISDDTVEERAVLSLEIGEWLELVLDDDEAYATERPRPDFQAILADLPDDPERRALVEAEVGPAPGAGAARREHIPERVRHEVWRRDEGRCVDCGSAERLEFDHVIPWSKGGSNTARNLRLLCEPCNRRKAARI